MAPVICLVWTTLAAISMIWNTGVRCAGIVVAGLAAAMLLNGFRGPIVTAAKAAIPLALPLAFVHGVVNPAFPAATLWLDAIPLRPIGFLYAILVSLRVTAILLLGALWAGIDVERLVNEARAVRMPLSVILTFTAAASTVRMVSRQIEHVYIAQQARGIAAGPGFLARLKALPTVVLPVVTASLVESAYRGDVLTIRGLGSGPLPPISLGAPSANEWFRAAMFVPVVVAALTWS